MAKKNVFMCDFETTTKEDDCRVWAACAVDMETGKRTHLSNHLSFFMEWVERLQSSTLYFHNLSFDGEFIISWLLARGYQHIQLEKNKKAVPEGCFTTLIDDMGSFYKMSICFRRKGNRVWKTDIYDSLKKVPGKAAKIAKDYGLPIAKGEIDYSAERPLGYMITEEETDYIETDCRIIQSVLHDQLDAGMTKMTMAGDALADYKERVGNKFDYWFPVLPVSVDEDIRKAYKGGFTYCNPDIADQDIEEGEVYDSNSHYPAAMYYHDLPYSYPTFFEGKYPDDPRYPLYIQQFRCAFKLKKDHIPTVQIKGNRSIWQETEYLRSSEVKVGRRKEFMEVNLCMTSVDLKLFLDHYDIIGEITYINGYMFRAQKGMFKDYIDHWMHIKETSPKKSSQRQTAKLYLNSLYGKFGSSCERWNKIPVMCPDGVVRYYCRHQPLLDSKGNICFDEKNRIMWEYDEEGRIVEIPPTIEDPVYIPVAAFITAYARDNTIRSAQAVYDRFLYSDTDSIHLRGTGAPEGMEIHPTKLGAWDREKTFQRARFLRAKTYIEEVDGVLEVTCAGMPDNVKSLATWDNFHPGATYPGKLLPKRVKGGIVLAPVDFSIKL